MAMTDPLAGRAVLVTGASSGIGRAIALAAARARATEREIQSLGRNVVVAQLDLASEPSVRALGPAVRDALGRLDVWVNNAGADILTGAESLSRTDKLDLLLAV